MLILRIWKLNSSYQCLFNNFLYLLFSEKLQNELKAKEEEHNNSLDKLEEILSQKTDECETAKKEIDSLSEELKQLTNDSADQKLKLEKEIDELKVTVEKLTNDVCIVYDCSYNAVLLKLLFTFLM